MKFQESSNNRPGEPLRSWLDETSEVRHVDAMTVIEFANAKKALQLLIAGDALPLEDHVALGRLNSVAVARWYEPVVTMLPDPAIDPNVAAFIQPLLENQVI